MSENIDYNRKKEFKKFEPNLEILEDKKINILDWDGREIKNLTNYPSILDAIIEGKIPAAVIKAFDVNWCENAMNAMPEDQIIWHKERIPPVGRLGGTLQEFLDINKSFLKSANIGSQDPKLVDLYNRSRLNDLKSQYFGNFCEERGTQVAFIKDTYRQLITEYFEKSNREINVAKEGENEYHFPVVRFISNVKIHDDFTAKTAPDWEVGDIETQLATNLYLSLPEDGGEIIIYNKQRGGLDDKFKLPTFGYDSGIIKDAKKVIIKPQQGDFVIFNSTYLHEVTGSEPSNNTINNEDLNNDSKRVTVASFAGVKEDGSIIYWA